VGSLGFLGTVISAKYTSNVRVVKLEIQIGELEKKVIKHNGLVEKTYKLQERLSLVESSLEKIERPDYEC
jgi:hypothetical protein